MFESDDFDQVLSQFELPEVASQKSTEKENKTANQGLEHLIQKPQEIKAQTAKRTENITILSCASGDNKIADAKSSANISSNNCIQDNEKDKQDTTVRISKLDTFVSPKHTKRKIINSYFDHQSKRKFPGPAGLLTGPLEETKDESIYQVELFSQDIDCNQHSIQQDIFETPIWNRLLSDTQSWKLHDIDSIKTIKQQALSGNLRRRKAQTVIALVEVVDRSAIDPMIILRDSTGNIKCTLHRDAWSTFSMYIVSEYCALILKKPTVLTRGGAFKKHYLNITLSNILAIYSSTVLNEDRNKNLPEGYSIVYEERFTVIKSEKSSDNLETSLEQNNGAEDLFDGLDSFFTDDLF